MNVFVAGLTTPRVTPARAIQDNVITPLDTILTALPTAMQSYGQTAGDGFNQGLATGLAPASQTISLFVQQAALSLLAFVTNMQTFGETGGQGFDAALTPGLSSAGQRIDAFIRNAATSLDGWVSNMATFGQSGGDAFKNNLQPGLDGALNAFSSTAQSTRNAAGALAGALGDNGRRGGDSFRDGIRDGMDAAVSAAQRAASAITNAVAGIDLFGAGWNAGQSLAAGLDAAYGAVEAAAGRLAAAANSGTAGGLRASSPSKTMLERGQWAWQGFVLGLRDGLDPVRAAETALAQTANTVVDRFLTPLQRRRGEVAAAMRDLVADLPGAAGGRRQLRTALDVTLGGAGGGTTVIQVFAVKSDEYAALLAKAEAGAGAAGVLGGMGSGLQRRLGRTGGGA